MEMTEVFSHFERLGTESGVQVCIADRDPVTGQRGFGVGMAEEQKRYFRAPGPTMVLGLDSREVQTDRGFKSFLELPGVYYLELPFTREEFGRAAAKAKAEPVAWEKLDALRRSISLRGLDHISRNVNHRLTGVLLAALIQAVGACRRLAKTNPPHAGDAVLAGCIASLASSGAKVRDSLDALDREIAGLDGICAPDMAETLRDQRARLGEAGDDLAMFVAGITAWERGEMSIDPLACLAETGDKVSRAFKDADLAFARLIRESRVS